MKTQEHHPDPITIPEPVVIPLDPSKTVTVPRYHHAESHRPPIFAPGVDHQQAEVYAAEEECEAWQSLCDLHGGTARIGVHQVVRDLTAAAAVTMPAIVYDLPPWSARAEDSMAAPAGLVHHPEGGGAPVLHVPEDGAPWGVLVHEVAHLMCDRLGAHGPEFAAAMVRLAWTLGGPDIASALLSTYDEYGVDTAPWLLPPSLDGPDRWVEVAQTEVPALLLCV